ncbi:hypothetical protein NOV72_05210 [Caballeronia novacaledonica]|uniref:Uncharacterized protein n=1 Tax=Caballeronia novacaledonica TaxID=1544861 RepID=A0A2U3ID16_9BURK|nr:hypothetical protein NOV72_05210 [Caballeronia novacaledonica]
MDQREELRSLYSVVCPRCETVSQADDLSCPYCGADRHGAVLTRGHASLLDVGIDDAARAMVRAASSRVGESQRVEPDGAEQSLHEAGVRPLLSAPLKRFSRNRLVVVLTVCLLFVIGAYAWIRNASHENAGQSKPVVASAAGTVRELTAPVAPQAGSNGPKKTGAAKHEETILLAQDRSLALTYPMNHGFVGSASPCMVITGIPSLSATSWCSKLATAPTIVETAEKGNREKVSAARRPPSNHSISTRGHASKAHVHANGKPARGRSEAQATRHAGRQGKTRSRPGMPPRAASPSRKESLGSTQQPTSSGNEPPGKPDDRSTATRSETSPRNRGRGEAH